MGVCRGRAFSGRILCCVRRDKLGPKRIGWPGRDRGKLHGAGPGGEREQARESTHDQKWRLSQNLGFAGAFGVTEASIMHGGVAPPEFRGTCVLWLETVGADSRMQPTSQWTNSFAQHLLRWLHKTIRFAGLTICLRFCWFLSIIGIK